MMHLRVDHLQVANLTQDAGEVKKSNLLTGLKILLCLCLNGEDASEIYAAYPGRLLVRIVECNVGSRRLGRIQLCHARTNLILQ